MIWYTIQCCGLYAEWVVCHFPQKNNHTTCFSTPLISQRASYFLALHANIIGFNLDYTTPWRCLKCYKATKPLTVKFINLEWMFGRTEVSGCLLINFNPTQTKHYIAKVKELISQLFPFTISQWNIEKGKIIHLIFHR